MTVKELFQLCKTEIENGNGNRDIVWLQEDGNFTSETVGYNVLASEKKSLNELPF